MLAYFAVIVAFTIDSAHGAVNPRSWMPLLSAGSNTGVVYGEGSTAKGRNATSAGFQTLVKAGASVFPMAMAWSDLEKSPGNINVTEFENLLQVRQRKPAELLGMRWHALHQSTACNILAGPI